MKKTLLNAGLALCTVGAAIFAVGASEDAILKRVQLPARAFYLLLLSGGLLVGLGVAALILSVLFNPIEAAISRVLYGDLNSRYVSVNARGRDLIGLHDFYTKYFGSDVPSIDLMKSWIVRCKSAFVLVHRVSQASGLAMKEELVGSFKLLPLTLDAVRALDAGQITGSMFKAEHVARNKKETLAVYVGDVAATSQFARAMVLAQLNAACTPAVSRGLPIYARPLTPDGLRVMTKHGFVQVSDGTSPPEIGRICKLESGKLGRLRAASGRRLLQSRRVKPSDNISGPVR
jgi:hypothetical protein